MSLPPPPLPMEKRALLSVHMTTTRSSLACYIHPAGRFSPVSWSSSAFTVHHEMQCSTAITYATAVHRRRRGRCSSTHRRNHLFLSFRVFSRFSACTYIPSRTSFCIAYLTLMYHSLHPYLIYMYSYPYDRLQPNEISNLPSKARKNLSKQTEYTAYSTLAYITLHTT